MVSIENAGAYLPEHLANPTTGFRYAEIYPDVARLLSIAYTGKHELPPPRVHPETFEEIYAMRDDLASFEVSLGRRPEDQQAYYAFIHAIKDPDQLVLGKIDLSKQKVIITPNEFPAAVPHGVEHLLAWYSNETPPTFVVHSISEYIESRKLSTSDFVLYGKPSSAGPFIPGFSRSITIPHVHLLVRA
jgi:hypothetical protein